MSLSRCSSEKFQTHQKTQPRNYLLRSVCFVKWMISAAIAPSASLLVPPVIPTGTSMTDTGLGCS